jgi:hypothetical protein
VKTNYRKSYTEYGGCPTAWNWGHGNLRRLSVRAGARKGGTTSDQVQGRKQASLACRLTIRRVINISPIAGEAQQRHYGNLHRLVDQFNTRLSPLPFICKVCFVFLFFRFSESDENEDIVFCAAIKRDHFPLVSIITHRLARRDYPW